MTVDLSSQADMEFKPTLYDVHKLLDEDVVGEYESRLSLFTNWVLSGQNVLMSGPRSSGKTWVTDHVVGFLGGNAFTVSSGSDKSNWYMLEEINNATHIIILELNKCPKDFLEVLKDWGEGKDSRYNTTIVDGGERRVKKFTLKRKPYVFCLADEDEMKVNEQLMSRLTRVRMDNSVSQNAAVLRQQAKLATDRANTKQIASEQKERLYYHVQTLPLSDSIAYKHPAADEFVDVVPKLFTDCRRDFPKYLANTFGITRFHWKERVQFKLGKKDTYLVSPQDMYLNHEIYGQTLIESALKCSSLEREMIKIVEDREAVNRQIVQQDLRRVGLNISAHMVTKHMNQIADLGYVGKMKEGASIVYTKSEREDFRFSINWKNIVEISRKTVKELYPEVTKQYEEMHCVSPWVKHPFTGEVIDLNQQTSHAKSKPKDKLTSYISVKPTVEEEEIV